MIVERINGGVKAINPFFSGGCRGCNRGDNCGGCHECCLGCGQAGLQCCGGCTDCCGGDGSCDGNCCSEEHIERIGQLGPSGMSALSPSLSQLSALTHLDLGGNGIGSDGFKALAGTALPHLVSLERLELRANDLGSDGARALVSKVVACGGEGFARSLWYLGLAQNDLCDADVVVALVGTMLPALPRLIELDLREMQQRSREVRKLAEEKLLSAAVGDRVQVHMKGGGTVISHRDDSDDGGSDAESGDHEDSDEQGEEDGEGDQEG